MRRNLPSIDCFIGITTDRFPNHKIVQYIDSGNNGRLFRAFDSTTGNNLAFKFVPVENLPDSYERQNNHLNEAKKANLIDHRSVVKYYDVFLYEDTKNHIRCVVFVCDYIKGQNLRSYIKEHGSNINIAFVETFLRTMFELLYELQERNLQHGDLHAGNVLVATSEYDVYGRPGFRVTDFGVRELTGHSAHGNDYFYVAEILGQLLEKIKYNDCEGRDRYAYDILGNDFLRRHLIDTDGTADQLANNPQGLLKKLDDIDDQYRAAKTVPATKLQSPFDYPNCEQIGNSHLLLQNLYSDRLLGLAEIQNRSHLILTGPRGCGKTTVFRALSLEYLASTDNDAPEDLPYIGIYYRCDDLYFSFPRYEIPDRREALDVPVHFLTVTLLAVALEQVSVWAKKHFLKEWERQEEKLVAELWKLFEWTPPDDPAANQLPTLLHRLRAKERKRAARKQRFVNVPTEPIENYLGPRTIFDACRLIREKLPFLDQRQFYFFVDDYSHPKITKALQANLNRLVLHRNPDVFFKLSTESPVSFAREDVDGKQYVESREYDLLNLGLRYIASESEQTLEFLEDLFARRFQEVENYPVKTLEELLGSTPRNENRTARAFREKRDRGQYAGKETVAAMCSGDIHYMIRLVGNMVEDFGGREALTNAKSRPPISAQLQHDSIRAAAGSFIESVRTLPRCGQRLANIVSAFGSVAHSYLLYETSSNQKGNPPHQLSRIEPYEPLNLSSEARDILDELLRYSIFIEDPRGMSRRRKTVPRFYLRRYLIPHFQLTFSRRDSLQLENKHIEALLCDPQKFQDQWRLRSNEDAARRRGRRGTCPNQIELSLKE